MCGIVGILEYGSGRHASPEDVERMNAALLHRGPDDAGLHFDRELGLGMRRLSIIDVQHGHQPVHDEKGDVTVVCNGEIYNYRSLAGELTGRGHRLLSTTDTEVIPHLYEEQGADFVQTLRGMFAVALWDAARRRLLLVRDRLGIKPLYYFDDGQRLIFASEIKALLEHPCVTARLNPSSCAHYLSLKYVPSPETLFAGIQSLPPGHLLTCDAGGVRTSGYWDVPMRTPASPRTDDEYAAEFAQLLRESVGLHLQSDVPFGAFLSGGLDSSLIVGLMQEVLPDPVRTFSVGFSALGQSSGELGYASIVANAFGTRHAELVMNGADFVDTVERSIWHLDQPIGDVAAVPMMLLSELAAKDVKMVLSGEGGDELFAGYARYVGESVGRPLDLLPAGLRRALLVRLRDRVNGNRPKIALHALSEADSSNRMANWFPLLNDEQRRSVVLPEFLEQEAPTVEQILSAHLDRVPAENSVNRMLYADTKLWLPDDLLARGDKMSMSASIELRVPLLDHHVVEFAAQLPRHLKLRRLTRKVLLRNLAEGLVPREVLQRRKEGFPVPIAQWFRGEAREMLADTLSPAALQRRGIFDPRAVRTLIEEHWAGNADHALMLWGMFALELWCQRFLDGRR